MKIIIAVLSFFIFTTSLFGLDAKVKYDKVISSVEKYYYIAFTKDQIINKGIAEFLASTSLLNADAKKKINTKFTFYDNKYGADSKECAYEKIKTIIEFLLQQMFSNEEVYDILIHSTMNSLDAHSSYLDKKHMQELKVQTEGVFGGLGITVSKKEKKLTVVSPLDNTPAFRAGIKAGDIILKINELPCENMSLNKAVSLMRGKVDTSINLTISRKGELIPITIVRELIKIRSVDARELPNDILYLKISTFDKKVINDLSKAIKNYETNGMGIILDLRNNPGGLLSEAVDVVDMFMNRGNIITQQGRSSFDKVSYDTSKEKTLTEAPLVVLINAGSASASEIVSGALQVHHRATLMGERSFGKGYVQAILPIDEEESVKLTVAEYLLADGKSIHNIGIKPDYEIDADIVDGYDRVLEAAQDYLNNKAIFDEKYLAKAYGIQTLSKRFRNKNIAQKEAKVYEATLRDRFKKIQKAPADSTKWLISIGIENYEYTADVKYSKKSAELFSELLQKKYGIEDHHSLVLVDGEATMGRIKNKMKRLLRQVKAGDTIYFYYNGHGIPVPSQKNEPYLLPNDVEPEFASDDKFFKMQNIYNLLSQTDADKVIAIIDSCFSGGNDGAHLIKGVAATRLVPKEVSFNKKKMVILFAGRGTQYSNMYEQKGHRLFSYYVMDSILKGRDDVEMLYNEVYVNVKDESFKMGDMHLQEPTVVGNKKLNFR
ncbi:periplasmic protease, S41A subfamily [Sulfurimonas gotlandica GD1]|uniref:Periplasmic protease, S41A subfamily n=1 Tax=Sulfurimonas gotlandica (strain DSM 19862 / JCM 16533 / GD1) TaxID=929558 RepID=B6BIJ2_SULGG|nr:S41 family peptidase [Sulfurimonas gotlandica]EDZ63837.1 carboxy-terminal processing protease [Sulfurimonas gotlandica GD1]EHP30347.1 periplasmic protease, S41A subfamily [Sulfurimonas gotlandica GD1]